MYRMLFPGVNRWSRMPLPDSRVGPSWSGALISVTSRVRVQFFFQFGLKSLHRDDGDFYKPKGNCFLEE